MNNEFFEMVKEWTVSDYRTPGIKAEVILDMLISEFIEKLIHYHYFKNSDGEKVTLLVKEFPIRTLKNEKNSKRNAKVDYLVSVDNKKLVLVELKTADKSFNDEQLNRMKTAINGGTEKLMDFYYGIAGFEKKNSNASRKYEYSKQTFIKNLQKAGLDINTIKAISNLECLYISLTDSKNIKGDKLILTEYCSDDSFKKLLTDKQRQPWESVSEILKECAGKE